MSAHGKTICEGCGTVIKQCRCPNHNRVTLGLCKNCEGKPTPGLDVQAELLNVQSDNQRLQDTINAIRNLDFESIGESAMRDDYYGEADGLTGARWGASAVEDAIDTIIRDGIK